MYTTCNKPSHQRGATLVLALIAVLVVVALATRISRDYFVLQRSLEYQNELDQARAYLRGAESVAKEALLLDLKSGSTSDSIAEAWVQPRQLPLAEGVLDVCLLDLQGRLNLNDLGASTSEGTSAAQKRFIRLLQVVRPEHPLDLTDAVPLANAVFDWVDADGQRRNPGGAEELDYLQAGHDWRPANQRFASVSELALVAGFDADLVAALTPFVSVWGNGKLNVNMLDTALSLSASDGMQNALKDGTRGKDGMQEKPVPVLLRTLGSSDSLKPISEQAARLIAAARSRTGGGFSSLGVFQQLPLAQLPWDLSGLDVASDYFQMTADLHTGMHHHRMVSVLARVRDAAGRPQVVVKSRTLQSGEQTGEGDCAVARQ